MLHCLVAPRVLQFNLYAFVVDVLLVQDEVSVGQELTLPQVPPALTVPVQHFAHAADSLAASAMKHRPMTTNPIDILVLLIIIFPFRH